MITLQQLITVGVFAVLAQAMFVGAEIALGSCDRARLRQRAGAGGKGARAAERLLAKQETTAATVLVGATASSLTIAAATALYLSGRGFNHAWAALISGLSEVGSLSINIASSSRVMNAFFLSVPARRVAAPANALTTSTSGRISQPTGVNTTANSGARRSAWAPATALGTRWPNTSTGASVSSAAHAWLMPRPAR